MKITGFRPLIISSKSEDIISLFEDLGFERRHTKTGINDDVTAVTMKDENGNRVNVVQVDQMPQDMMSIAMNVDNFEEAYVLLAAKGFKNAQGDKVTDTGSSKATMMTSPSGFSISLSEHIKK
jgi:glutaminase